MAKIIPRTFFIVIWDELRASFSLDVDHYCDCLASGAVAKHEEGLGSSQIRLVHSPNPAANVLICRPCRQSQSTTELDSAATLVKFDAIVAQLVRASRRNPPLCIIQLDKWFPM